MVAERVRLRQDPAAARPTDAAELSSAGGLPVGDLPTAGVLTVDQPVPDVALAVGAHPDDVEFGCGATLARWASSGCRVHHLVLTDGSKGSWDPGADVEALVAARQVECREAAAVLDGPPGAVAEARSSGNSPGRVIFLGRIDGELTDDIDSRRAVAHCIRTVRPSVVLGHDPWRRYRLHPDHRVAGYLTLDAVVAARDPHFFPELGLAPHRPDSILLFEADLPNHVEDASGFEARKVDALLCHRSQYESTMGIAGPRLHHGDQPGPDQAVFDARVRRQLAEHGALAQLAAGEAFHRISPV